MSVEIRSVRGHYELYYQGKCVGSEDTEAEAYESACEYEQDLEDKEDAIQEDLKNSYNRSSDFVIEEEHQ